MRFSSSIILLLLTTTSLVVSSFHIQNKHRHPSFIIEKSSILSSIRESSSTEINGNVDVEESGKKRTTTLRFFGDSKYESKPIPSSFEKQRLDEFMVENDDTIKILLSGSENTNIVEYLKEDEEDMAALYREWKVMVEKGKDEDIGDVEFAQPTEGDEVVKVTTTAMSFPGLRMKTISYNGVKKLPSDASSSKYPEVQFVMIKDKLEAEGAPPLVWIFKKLTGGDGDGAEKKNKSIAMTRTVMKDVDGEGISFEARSSLLVTMNFPALLMKVVPFSVEKGNRVGSDAFKKLLEKEQGPTVENLRGAFLEWSQK